MTTFSELAIRQEISVARRAVDHARWLLDTHPPAEIGTDTMQLLNSLLADAGQLLGALTPLTGGEPWERAAHSPREADDLTSRTSA